FGTVVTGTLLAGSLAVGDEIAVVPSDIRGRIRGLQTHRRSLEVARPGSRVAANLSGVDKEAVTRGMVVTRPGSLATTTVIAVRLALLASASAALEHDEEVKVHVGTAETMARAALLEGSQLAPGESAWAQLRLATPVAVAVGDRLVIRRPSPSETIGGGTVADLATARLRRRAEPVAARGRIARGSTFGAWPAGEALQRASRAACHRAARGGARKRARAAIAPAAPLRGSGATLAQRACRSCEGPAAAAEPGAARDRPRARPRARLGTRGARRRRAHRHRSGLPARGGDAVRARSRRRDRVERIDHGRSRAGPLGLQPQARASAPTIPRRSWP